jgi:hypothetical protein
MIKTSLLFLATLFLAGCETVPRIYGSPATPFQKVVEVNQPAEILFTRSLEWYANSFKSAKAVIQYSSKETGTIIGKGQFPAGIPMEIKSHSDGATRPDRTIRPIDFTMNIDVKDGKVRVTFSSLYVTIHGVVGTTTGFVSEEFVDSINGYLSDFVDEYADYLKKQPAAW